MRNLDTTNIERAATYAVMLVKKGVVDSYGFAIHLAAKRYTNTYNEDVFYMFRRNVSLELKRRYNLVRKRRAIRSC